NTVVVILAVCFSAFPMLVERNLPKAGIYFAVAGVALWIDLSARHRDKHKKTTSRWVIYALMVLYYTNVMLFGIYLGVWSSPDMLAVTFMGFLIVSLFLFITPPTFNLCLTIGALALFTVSTMLLKESRHWIFDMVNAGIACLLSLIFNWRINAYRLLAVLNAWKLEEERNKYYSQSNIDELTQLNNRRFFMETFQRYLTHYRDTDERICLAILDVDFFKRYNDCYGHPKGDEVLRALGGVLNGMRDGMGIFAARIGGEEFALLWFDKDKGGADRIISHLQGKVEELNIPHTASDIAERVTLSVGVYITQCRPSNNIQTLYDFTDKALYEAKHIGRNCAVVRGEALKPYVIRL
ncbi:MAG: GGDEF domain-containing protein, partial [Oscillospiraceae bacterium]|nr:GGDEF domain-containing protein [Oscillospiraceae bacterium]